MSSNLDAQRPEAVSHHKTSSYQRIFNHTFTTLRVEGCNIADSLSQSGLEESRNFLRHLSSSSQKSRMNFWAEISGVNIRNPAYSSTCCTSQFAKKILSIVSCAESLSAEKHAKSETTPKAVGKCRAQAAPKKHGESRSKNPHPSTTQTVPRYGPSTEITVPKYGPSTEKKRTPSTVQVRKKQ